MEIQLLFNTPSINIQLRENRFKKRARIEKIVSVVRRQLFKSRAMIRFQNPVTIEYTRFSFKELDEDNLGGSFKPIGDALVKLGIIKDDSPKFVKLISKQSRGNPKTHIKITKNEEK